MTTPAPGGANLPPPPPRPACRRELGPLTGTAATSRASRSPGLTQDADGTAFALPAGGESEVEDAGHGEFFAVRVEKIIPPAMPPLDEIRPMLTRAWTQRELRKALQAKADALVARLKKGETLEAVAASPEPASRVQPASTGATPARTGPGFAGPAGRCSPSRPGDVFTAPAPTASSSASWKRASGGRSRARSLMLSQRVPRPHDEGYLRDIGRHRQAPRAQPRSRRRSTPTAPAGHRRSIPGAAAAAGKPRQGPNDRRACVSTLSTPAYRAGGPSWSGRG